MRIKYSHIRNTGGIRSLELTPLIDCIFLLLIFFMLTSHFVIAPGISLQLPKSASTQAIEVTPLIITVSSEDIIYIHGRPVTIAELREYFSKKKEKKAFIKADRQASLGIIIEIFDIMKEFNIEKVGLATLPKS